MRILAGLTGVAALIAFSAAPAMAECNWSKMSQKTTPTTTAEAPQSSIATNDLSEALIVAGNTTAQTGTQTAE
ncbi:hypothetical protein [Stappia sp. P2PMeth1]|uniref:hypothetical protein n=1 Tax=Stappia sp. P2PMeth1 TaxID=2003586 RepID=UPI001644730E|nr:hypothetical protein [Stappia sp. P2PMeth1]